MPSPRQVWRFVVRSNTSFYNNLFTMSPFICCVFNMEGIPIANVPVTIRPPNQSPLGATTNSEGFAGVWTSHARSSEPRFIHALEFPEFFLTVHLMSPYDSCWSKIHADVRLIEMPDCCLIVRLGVAGTYEVQYITLPAPKILRDEPHDIASSHTITPLPAPTTASQATAEVDPETKSESEADCDGDEA